MSEQRRPLVSHIFTADPSAHVFNGKIYIYPSHDIPHDGEDNDDGDEYRMEDYHILSMDGPDAPCVDHGCALHMRDVPWVGKQMWAPDGPFTYRGRIMEPVLGWTTHHSIVEYRGKWYLFYHDCELSNGINHRLCVKFTELTIRPDGTIETIRPYEGE